MATSLEPDAVVAGYRVVEVLGSGGMGVVYRARQPSLDRDVALKVIAAPLFEDDRFRKRFERESRLAASIQHPHVLPVYEAGEHRGLMFIAMQFVAGGDLGQLIAARGRLEPAAAVRVVSQVADALDAAHARGLVHRDVKPGNVLVVEREGELHAFLADFGLSAREGSRTGLTVTGALVGTPDYIAPEQITQSRVDGRADVYALGCVLFKALTGRPPFPRDGEVATMWAHMRDDPPPVSATKDVPAAMDAVVSCAMAKVPEERYQSGGELARAAAAAAGLSVASPGGVAAVARRRRPGSAPAGRRFSGRPPLWVAGAALLAGAAAAGILALGGALGGSHTKRHEGTLTSDGTLLKARGDPGIYVVKAGAKFLTTAEGRAAFFAGEGQELHLVSGAFLAGIPNIPREGSRLKAYGSPIVWVIHKGHRSPVKPPGGAGAVTVPKDGLVQIPLRASGHKTSLFVTAPRYVREDQDFRVTALARSRAGVPTGTCVFFRFAPQGVVERAKAETRNGRCAAILRVTNVRHVRYSVHFYGDRGWRFPTASTRRIYVVPR